MSKRKPRFGEREVQPGREGLLQRRARVALGVGRAREQLVELRADARAQARDGSTDTTPPRDAAALWARMAADALAETRGVGTAVVVDAPGCVSMYL